MSDFGFIETNLEASPSTSSWSMRYTLQDEMGRYLHMSSLELTSNAKLARLITATQAANIRKLWPEAKALTLRKGTGR